MSSATIHLPKAAGCVVVLHCLHFNLPCCIIVPRVSHMQVGGLCIIYLWLCLPHSLGKTHIMQLSQQSTLKSALSLPARQHVH